VTEAVDNTVQEVAVCGPEKHIDFNNQIEECKSPTQPPTWPPTVENSEVIDLEALMEPPKCQAIVKSHNLRERPPKTTPNPDEEDSGEFDIFQRIRLGLVDNGIFEVECPIGSGVIKKILGRQLHWAYKEWKKQMDFGTCSFSVYNMTMPRSLGEEEEEEEEALKSTQGQKGRHEKAAVVTTDPWTWPYYDAKPRENVNPVTTRSVLVNYEDLASLGAYDQTNELVLRTLVEVSFNFGILDLHARNSHPNSKFELHGSLIREHACRFREERSGGVPPRNSASIWWI
jgi:hypothetical protein